VNETLCRALLQARLTEEDVAVRLRVDPKTVRRWLEGRVPYLRHRWALAATLGLDETDLWPQLRNARSRPDEVQAVYPHLDAVPEDVWLRLFGSAKRQIGVLADAGQPLTGRPRLRAVLAERAAAGVSVRICLRDPDALGIAQRATEQEGAPGLAASVRNALATFSPLAQESPVDIRLHRVIVYSFIYYADDQLLVSQNSYGVPPGHAPVLHLRPGEGGDMVAAYLGSFEQVWAGARPVD
jgi:transcriptional regulator with XRE-family HTH domain